VNRFVAVTIQKTYDRSLFDCEYYISLVMSWYSRTSTRGH